MPKDQVTENLMRQAVKALHENAPKDPSPVREILHPDEYDRRIKELEKFIKKEQKDE